MSNGSQRGQRPKLRWLTHCNASPGRLDFPALIIRLPKHCLSLGQPQVDTCRHQSLVVVTRLSPYTIRLGCFPFQVHMCVHTQDNTGISSLHLPWVPGLELKSSVTAVGEPPLSSGPSQWPMVSFRIRLSSGFIPTRPLLWDRYTSLPHYCTHI